MNVLHFWLKAVSLVCNMLFLTDCLLKSKSFFTNSLQNCFLKVTKLNKYENKLRNKKKFRQLQLLFRNGPAYRYSMYAGCLEENTTTNISLKQRRLLKRSLKYVGSFLFKLFHCFCFIFSTYIKTNNYTVLNQNRLFFFLSSEHSHIVA